jgi:pyruvate carboxylase subunit A
MQRALYEYVITGPVTNIPFHLAMFENDVFRAGDYATTFITEHPEIFDRISQIIDEDPTLKLRSADDSKKKLIIAAAAVEGLLSSEVSSPQPSNGWSWTSKLDFAERGR